MAKSFSDLPEDTVIDILLRLPVKSLLRLKSVSKSWLHNITNPHFIKSHLAQQKLNLLAIADAPFTPNCCSPPASPVNFEFLEIPTLFYQCQAVASYNGIVCVANFRRSLIFLWNPSIKKYKRVLIPGSSLGINVRFHNVPENYFSIGFLYDYISDDYKVLMFLYYKNRYRYDNALAVKLYSAKTDSWKSVPVPVHPKLPASWFTMSMMCGPVINGVFYFELEDEIVSFDLRNEVFELVRRPCFEVENRSNVFEFEGSVAMVYRCVSDGMVSLWTLGNDSGEVLWTKKICFDGQLQIERVFMYVGAGKFYGGVDIWDNKWNRLVLYDSEKNETVDLQLPSEDIPYLQRYTANNPAIGSLPPVFKYAETLVSVRGFEPVDPFIE